VAGVEQPLRHAAAHYSQTDETEIRHEQPQILKFKIRIELASDLPSGLVNLLP
jgi:hypothetical protein